MAYLKKETEEDIKEENMIQTSAKVEVNIGLVPDPEPINRIENIRLWGTIEEVNRILFTEAFQNPVKKNVRI